jgi:pyruvate,water dikinase
MHILDSREAADAPAARIGGKAHNLAALARTGVPVPPWLCVTTQAFASLLAQLRPQIAPALETLPDDPAQVQAVSTRIRALFAPALLPAADAQALLSRFDRLFPAGTLVSVRSSAVGEDSRRDSFAGQMDSYLFVTRETLVERVLACLGSAFSARSLMYRRLRKLDFDTIAAAAIVQQMVDSRAAGVLFTANPTTGNRRELVISAGLGLGEGVVADLVESDTYFVNDGAQAIAERKIAEKRGRVAFDRARGAGTVVVEVPPDEGARPVLDDAQIRALADVGRTVEAAFGAPQDIEWAFDCDGKLYLLQTRPITTLERETIFDNSNIVESYPGLSLPLTFSFARAAYEQTFRAASAAFGTSPADLDAHRNVHANLVALVDGRIYYNILNWYQLFVLLPGLERAIPAWEKALGIERRHARSRRRATVLERVAGVPARLRVLGRLSARFFGLEDAVREFTDTFVRVQEDFKRRDLDALDAHDLFELYEEVAGALCAPYSISVVNDFFTQQLYDLVARLIARWDLGDPMALRNDLMCAESGMDSVEPVRSILQITDRIRASETLRTLFGDGGGRAVWEALARGRAPEHVELRAAIEEHFDRYGDRTLEELKLETRPMRDDPELFVTMLRNYLRGGSDVCRPLVEGGREQQIRARAEAAVTASLRLHPLRRAVFDYVLSHARQGVKNRENLRLLRTRGFGMIKRIFRALAARLVRDGLLADVEDVFYLTVEEVAGTVRGHAVTRDLAGLVALRKRDYTRFRERAPAPRVVKRGIVYKGSFEGSGSRESGAADGATELRGIGCSPGTVTARAKVILSPEQNLDIRGEILIAPMTDPGWVFLMVAAAGIVSEKGSILSHTAIIGRELGIPTVVGVTGATRRIADGQIVEIDGQAGRVRLRQDAAPVVASGE